MSYDPATDFLGLLRITGGGVRSERMPGLDYVVEALARMGFVNVHVGQSAPVANQATTAWFLPAIPSWTAEGTLFLWNSITQKYELATPALWTEILQITIAGYSFQSAPDPVNNVAVGTSLVAVQRAAPAATSIILPNLGQHFIMRAKKIQIVDFSTAVVNHDITISTPDGSTIMQQNNWNLVSTPAQLSGVGLQPCPELNSWVIAP